MKGDLKTISVSECVIMPPSVYIYVHEIKPENNRTQRKAADFTQTSQKQGRWCKNWQRRLWLATGSMKQSVGRANDKHGGKSDRPAELQDIFSLLHGDNDKKDPLILFGLHLGMTFCPSVHVSCHYAINQVQSTGHIIDIILEYQEKVKDLKRPKFIAGRCERAENAVDN